MFLTTDQVANTRIAPVEICAFGHVYGFRVGHCLTTLNGALLRIGIDGNVYAVFPDSGTAYDYVDYFPFCQIACFGNHDNAYLLAKVH